MLLLLWAASSTSAQTAQNVAVVINQASEASTRIGEYYIRARRVPASNVIRIRTADAETIDRQAYVATIEQPIAATLARERLQDRILYIVLTKGVPLRINGTNGQNGTVSSVDSELTLLYRRMTGDQPRIPGRIDNPYFLGAAEVSQAKPFTHRDYDIYLVSRLDAYTVQEATALVDRAQRPATDGKIVLDQRDALFDRTGDDWLATAAKRLTAMGKGDRVVLESTPAGARDVAGVLGYYSWGSNDPRNRARTFNMGFLPGSLAATFVSTDARTFRQPPAGWVPAGDWDDKSKFFADSPQTLIADLIHDGATGVAGHVAEPYLQSTIRPDVLFPAYESGFNLIESFYLAMPHLSWQTVVVGDPLCSPFAKNGIPPGDLDSALDPDTQLPAWFSKRRVERAMAASGGLAEAVVTMAVRAEGQLARGDIRGARATLDSATQQAPASAALHLQLALIEEQLGDRAAARERYRRILELQPANAIALNNLAYAIATDDNKPAEALPLARRAVAAAPRDGTVLDTLAWIEHLTGDHRSAVSRIAQAIQLAPANADVRLHAALINAAAGAPAVAEAQLTEALRLNPALDRSEDVRKLRATLEQSKRK